MNKSINLLVIDDDSINLFITKKLIQSTALPVVVATKLNGQEGIDYLQEEVLKQRELPDLIFLDVNMPVLDGWGFLSAYQSAFHTDTVPVYMFTASAFEDDIKRAETYRIVKGFINKPLSKEVLIELFTACLDRKYGSIPGNKDD